LSYLVIFPELFQVRLALPEENWDLLSSFFLQVGGWMFFMLPKQRQSSEEEVIYLSVSGVI